MRSLQKKILDHLEAIATAEDFELVQVANFSNTGKLFLQLPDEYFVYAVVDYDFQQGKSKVNLNNAQPTDRQNYFYFDATDSHKIETLVQRFQALVNRARKTTTAA